MREEAFRNVYKVEVQHEGLKEYCNRGIRGHIYIKTKSEGGIV
jgi:hypothetical protein